ncbi:hypothetical protein ANCCAN_07091, partial [Ancylostoma caninum]
LICLVPAVEEARGPQGPQHLHVHVNASGNNNNVIHGGSGASDSAVSPPGQINITVHTGQYREAASGLPNVKSESNSNTHIYGSSGVGSGNGGASDGNGSGRRGGKGEGDQDFGSGDADSDRHDPFTYLRF